MEETQRNVNLECWKAKLKEQGLEENVWGAKTEEAYGTPEKTNVFPRKKDVFRAFELCNPDDVKVVILGQDPYFGKDGNTPWANGLAFGTGSNYVPKSLQKIIDIVGEPIDHSLETWAEQGVLLLNTALTVVENTPESHLKVWRKFTDEIIYNLLQRENVCFICWGAKAKKAVEKHKTRSATVYTSCHPMARRPAGEFGYSDGKTHFELANAFLKEKGREPIIDWETNNN